MNLNTDAVKEQILDLKDSLEDLQDSLSPLTTSLESYTQDLDAIAKAKILVTLCYALDSLLFCYLKCTGTRTEEHTIMNELERIRQYVNKIKGANGKRTTTLNKLAAKRMIVHDLQPTPEKHIRFEESMFDESKNEKKIRVRKERRAAKKERMKKSPQ